MLVLDTDLLTLIQRKSGQEYERLNARLEAAAGTELVFVTIVSYEEQTRGWLALLAKSKRMDRQVDAYSRLRAHLEDYRSRLILDFDVSAVRCLEQLQSLRVRIGAMDLKIAAICLANDATLISHNLRDFRKVPGLRVEDWSA